MRILEIGPGNNPAIFEPGSILQEADVEYFSLELIPENSESWMADYESEPWQRYLGSLSIGNCADMPYADQCFSHVIMRSVFGEPTDQRAYPGRKHKDKFAGLQEAFRVLEADGEIVITEENTPPKPKQLTKLGWTLLAAGFEDVTVYPCQDLHNPYWLNIRTQYWGMGEPVNNLIHGAGQPIDMQCGYLVHAWRPDGERTSQSSDIMVVTRNDVLPLATVRDSVDDNGLLRLL